MKFRVDLTLIRFPNAWLRERRLQRLTREALAFVSVGADRTPGFDKSLALWLLRSKDHVAVWLNVTAFYEEAARSLHYPELSRIAVAINGCRTPSLRDIGAPELSAESPAPASIEPERSTSRSWISSPIARIAASIAIVAIGGGTLWIRHTFSGANQYVTQIGEHRAVRLPDGTSVHLNTDSRIAVSFTRDRRRVELLQGEALFDIARDPRPFRVRTGAAVIEDIGTRFDVRVDAQRINVSVIEGQVRIGITPHPESADEQWPRVTVDTLNAGESVSIPKRPDAEPPVVDLPSDEVLANRLAWTRGMILFNGDSLSDAVREFNRYNVRQLRIVDPELGELRIGGQFLATSPDRFAQALRPWGVSALKPEPGSPLSEPIRLVRTPR